MQIPPKIFGDITLESPKNQVSIMPKIADCGVTLSGLKVQITQGLFRATFEEAGCFYLFLDLWG